MTPRKEIKEIKVGPGTSLTLFAIWLVGLVMIVKWIIEGIF